MKLSIAPIYFFGLLPALILASALGHAQPLMTMEAQTLGRTVFEAGSSISARQDKFKEPETTYKTVVFPIFFNIGVTNRLDFGFGLTYFSHSLDTPTGQFSGSLNGQFNTNFKFAMTKNTSLYANWHVLTSEDLKELLPIGRGNDVEVHALYSHPAWFNPHFNLGYVFKGPYTSGNGIRTGASNKRIEPGNIIEAKGAVEVPIKFNFNFLTELAYYNIDKKVINGIDIPNSAGDALDVLIGGTWVWKGWRIGMGGAFGLLEENLSSFDLERGAGDGTFKLFISYRLKPRRPDKFY